MNYATGPRAQGLLSVSADWWNHHDSIRFRYEDLAVATATVLSRASSELGPFVQDVAAVIASQSLQALRATSTNEHFWQGTPGLWKRLLTQSQAESVAAAHREVLVRLGYSLDQVQWPTEDQIASAWAALCAPSETACVVTPSRHCRACFSRSPAPAMATALPARDAARSGADPS